MQMPEATQTQPTTTTTAEPVAPAIDTGKALEVALAEKQSLLAHKERLEADLHKYRERSKTADELAAKHGEFAPLLERTREELADARKQLESLSPLAQRWQEHTEKTKAEVQEQLASLPEHVRELASFALEAGQVEKAAAAVRAFMLTTPPEQPQQKQPIKSPASTTPPPSAPQGLDVRSEWGKLFGGRK